MQDITGDNTQAVVIPFRGARGAAGLTGRDRLELLQWAARGCRVEIEDALAMIYRGDEPWAAWAIGRDGERLLVWNCVTHADIGRFDTMPEALAALKAGPGAAPKPAATNVIPMRRIAPAA